MNGSGPHWISIPGVLDADGSVERLPFLILAAIVLGILAGLLRPSRRRKKSWSRQWGGKSSRGSSVSEPSRRTGDWKLDRAVEQMWAVEHSGFERKPLLNREEERLLPVLEQVAREVGQGHRVMAQTSLGEVIRPTGRDTREAFGAINAKRLDFAIFDRRNLIVCAVEYQGTGHYQQGAAFRDSVKREALRKAGVRVLEVHAGFAEAGLMREVRSLLGAPARA